jgi:hypothetical protein
MRHARQRGSAGLPPRATPAETQKTRGFAPAVSENSTHARMLMAPGDFDPKARCRKRTRAHTQACAELMKRSHYAQVWINRALAEDEGGGDEPADMWLSVLLTKLQLQATDVDAAIHDAALQVAAIAPQMVRDIASVRAQVEAVRGDMAALMEEVSGVEASSEISVALLREVLAVKQRMAGVAEMLRQALTSSGCYPP